MPAKQFEASFPSLRQFECPAWFRDAKFGIWSHWGPQSVPMFGDWYARNMYMEGSPQYLYHLRHYGHPRKFGYKDMVKLWKAENFDPEGLMELYYKAGARYFVAQATHHDHFFNYPSKLNRFNSAQVGPMKDICGLWKAAAEKFGLPFGLTEHLSASFPWWAVNKGCDKTGPYAGVPYDGNDPAYRDFYHDNAEDLLPGGEMPSWNAKNKPFQAYWRAAMQELIDLFQPDLLYSDSGLPFGHHWDTNWTRDHEPFREENYRLGLDVVAQLYNTSIARHGENRAVYTQKDAMEEVYSVGVLDIERGQLSDIAPQPWQTDTCIGNWFYDAKQSYKTPAQVIETLVDIISKNGCLLLNILQRPDGTIDDENRYILEEMAAWYAVCGEGVYGTRPWRTYGEGLSSTSAKQFEEKEVAWEPSDIRFVCKGNTLFAFLMHTPESRVAVIQSLKPEERVASVRLLGGGAVPFAQNFGVLTVQLPETMPTDYVNGLEIAFERSQGWISLPTTGPHK